jgi:hypothetical protein
MDASNSALGLGFGDATRGRKVVSTQEFERDYEREGEGEEYYSYGGHGYGYGYGQAQQQPSTSGLARARVQNPPLGFDTTINSSSSPTLEKSSGRAGGIDVIEWGRWDVLGDR